MLETVVLFIDVAHLSSWKTGSSIDHVVCAQENTIATHYDH